MASGSDVLRGATTRVLPLLIGVPLVAALADRPPASLAEAASFAARAWVMVLVRPLVIATGFAVGLYVARARVSPQAARSGWRALLAVGVVLAAQLVGSLVVQAAGPAIGVPVDLAVGAVAAVAAYAVRRDPAVGPRAAA